MPIYEYACKKCGEQLEVLQKISDPAPEKCAKCGQGPMEKLISLTSFQLKGGGWYNDGYSSPAAKKTDEKVSTESPKTETKTESKPEKKEAKPSPAKESKST